MNLVLAGPGFIVNRWQVRQLAADVGWPRDGVGTGFLMAGVLMLAVGLVLLVFAYRRRVWVRSWWIASAAAVGAFAITSELLVHAVVHNLGAFV